MVTLSASKIKTAKDCSWNYWAHYHLKVPDIGNDGSSRGSVCHGVLEHLAKPQHREKYDRIMEADNVWADPVVQRYILIYAKKLRVMDDENLLMINDFIMVGLNYDFWGLESGIPDIDLPEQKFNIEVDENGKKYSMRGYIDRVFGYTNDKTVKIRDYKTSKSKFGKADMVFNLQVFMYQLAAKKLYPEFNTRYLDFLFLKIKKQPLLAGPTLTDEILEGFEYYLTDVARYLDNFNETNAKENMAAYGGYSIKWLCGKEGFKPDGTPHWICPHRRPRHFWAKINKETGEIADSAATITELDDEEGFVIREHFYRGCSAYYTYLDE